MKVNYGYIPPENRTQYESLMHLRDLDGNYALSAAQKKIVEYIGSMPRASGCFATEDMINEQSIRSKTRKTLKSHIAYLIHIGAVSKKIEGRKRVFRIETVTGTVLSLKAFRIAKGMSEYNYARTVEQVKITESIVSDKPAEPIDGSWLLEDEKEPLFLSNPQAKFASKNEHFAPKTANFATVLYKLETDLKKEIPPKRSPCISASSENAGDVPDDVLDFVGLKSDQLAAQAGMDDRGRPCSGEPPAPQEQIKISSNQKREEMFDGAWDEPLLKTKKTKKKASKGKDRRLSAILDHAQGHVVNPLGIRDNKPKRLSPNQARDIGSTGAVTISQLYRHLIKKYDAAFGEGIISQMLPDDRSAIGATFGVIKQRFLDACKYEPSNRDIAEYFDWILEPERASKLLGAAKYGNEKGSVHYNQLSGAAHIRKFYDMVLKRKVETQDPNDISISPESRRTREIVQYFEDAFEELRFTEKDSVKFIRSLMTHGVGVGAEFLRENKGMSAQEARVRIMSDMVVYFKASSDKTRATENLKIIVESAFTTRKILDDECIWFNLEQFTDGLVEEVLRKVENV